MPMTTVRALCERAFDAAGVGLAWEGEAEDEKGYDPGTGDCLIEVEQRVTTIQGKYTWVM